MKTEKKVVLDFSGLMPVDLNGKEWPLGDANKMIGNLIFVYCRSIEMDTIARSLHANQTPEVTAEELEVIKNVLEQQPPYVPIGMRAIIDHINSLVNK